METINDKIPLWLDLKKEYIDDNFERLLPYLHKNQYLDQKADPFYRRTIQLIRDRASDILKEIVARPLYKMDENKDSLIFNVRLLATCILVDRTSTDAKEIYLGLVQQLCLLASNEADALLDKGMEMLKHESISLPGFSFHEITNFKPEIFAYHIVNHSSFINPISKPLLYENHGRAWLDKDGLNITATGENKRDERAMKLYSNLETGNGCRISTRDRDKLKQTEQGSLSAIDQFMTEFAKAQEQPLKRMPEKRLMSYAKGDEAIVEITGIDSDGTMWVRTLDASYNPISGRIVFTSPTVAFYYTNLLHKYLDPGMRLLTTVTDAARGEFNFEKQLVEFLVEDTRTCYGNGELFHAKLLKVTKEGQYFAWINERGVTVMTFADPTYDVGDIAQLAVSQICFGPLYGRINAKIVAPGEMTTEQFDEKGVRTDCIREFSESTPEVTNIARNEVNELPLQEGILKIVARMFYAHQRTLLKPSERYCFLSNARALEELTGSPTDASFLHFTSMYLQAVVRFATDESLEEISLTPDGEFADSEPVRLRLRVIELLKEYGKQEYSQLLTDTIVDHADDMPLLVKLARLIQAANSVQGTLSDASTNILKREIIRALSLETEEDVDLEADTRVYIGAEGQTVEFKTSLVFPPNNNMQPNQAEQTNNVFKGICAFLNSMLGGTMYIGVNDSGYVTGLEQDFKYLKCTSFDSYSRFHIQDQLIKKFGLDVMTYIHIDEGYDGQVAVIRVDPHPYRVVELDDVAYLRVERESRIMPEKVKQEMVAKKMFTDNNKLAAILQLQHAAFKRRKAVLHGYASSNSGRVTDRTVEPYEVLPDHGVAICYDCSTNQCKAFNIARIGYVEVLPDTWSNAANHRKLEVDSFHMTGSSPVRVSLQLDLMAKNLMVEEFPRTRQDIKPDKGDENIWYYDATLQSVEGIGRFYLGLANHIEILSAPQLEKYVSDFKSKYL